MKTVNFPFSTILFARTGSNVRRAGQLRFLGLLKACFTNSRGEFARNDTHIGHAVGLTRQTTKKYIQELESLGFIEHVMAKKYRVISNKRMSHLANKLLGGIDHYREGATLHKICKISLELLKQPNQEFRMILDLAIMTEEQRSQQNAIQYHKRNPKRIEGSHRDSLLLSDGDLNPAFPYSLTCAALGRKTNTTSSTASRKFKKLKDHHLIDREANYRVLDPLGNLLRYTEIKFPRDYIPFHCYFSPSLGKYIEPLPSSFTVINSLGIEWVKRKF